MRGATPGEVELAHTGAGTRSGGGDLARSLAVAAQTVRAECTGLRAGVRGNVAVFEAFEFLHFCFDGDDGGVMGVGERVQGVDDAFVVNGPGIEIGGNVSRVLRRDQVNLIIAVRFPGRRGEERREMTK